MPPAVMLMVKLICADSALASATEIAKLYVPACRGRPDNCPLELRLSPLGGFPDAMLQV